MVQMCRQSFRFLTLYRWIIPVAVQAIVPVIVVFGAFLIRMTKPYADSTRRVY